MQRTPTRTPNKTPNSTTHSTRTPSRPNNGDKVPSTATPNANLAATNTSSTVTPRKNSQITSDLRTSIKPEDKIATNSFTEIIKNKNARVLHLQDCNISSFQGVANFPNMRAIDLANNPISCSLNSVLIAFRSSTASTNIKNVNGNDVTPQDIIKSFEFSGLVTTALRLGMKPSLVLDDNADLTLENSMKYIKKTTTPEFAKAPPNFVKNHEPFYKIEESAEGNGYTVTVTVKGDLYTWYLLDDEFNWKQLQPSSSTLKSITNPLNYPLKCEVKNVVLINKNVESNASDANNKAKDKANNSPDTKTLQSNETKFAIKSLPIFIPEYDHKYHVYAELSGDAAEGRLISVKAPLSSEIEWRHLDDESIINTGTLVLPLTPDEVGRIVCCDIISSVGETRLPKTRLLTAPVKAGEFRFRSLRLQGELVERDEIEFEVSTKGTKAKFVGIRILRSARHGDWEHIDFISASPPSNSSPNSSKAQNEPNTPNSRKNSASNSPMSATNTNSKRPHDDKLKYTLTVQDIGCVIRAVCITEGGGPPLMLTSNERVQPSAPRFLTPCIYGSLSVGMPLFAVAHYEGGLQGNCRYEWSIGGVVSTVRPVVVPSKADVGKCVSVRMTPIRIDGSIGQQVEASMPNPIVEGKSSMEEKYLEFKKRTRSGRLQMSFVEKDNNNSPKTNNNKNDGHHASAKDNKEKSLFVIREGETIIVSTPCDWAVVTQAGIRPAGHSKMFTADAASIKGIVVVFTDTFFAIAGTIEAAPPTASNVTVLCDKASAFLTASYSYSGGVEGRSIVQWNRHDGGRESVVGFGKSVHIGLSDRGCTYRAVVTPQSLDGKVGAPTASEPFLVEDDTVLNDERPRLVIHPPETTLQDCEIKLVVDGDPMPNPDRISYAILSAPLSKRNKVVWTCEGKTLSEGSLSFTPSSQLLSSSTSSEKQQQLTPTWLIGKVITIQIIDRLRNTTICECDLPPVDSQTASVSDVHLSIRPINDAQQRITVERKFSGGIESDSQVIWKIFDPKDTSEPITTITTTNNLSIPTDESVEGLLVQVEYFPKNAANPSSFGQSVLSEFLKIPVRHAPIISIVDATIAPNKDYTELVCKVKTEGEGRIAFEWGHNVDGEEIYNGEITKFHRITAEDFDRPVLCHVKPIGANEKLGVDAIVYPDPDVSRLFTPTINRASIQPKTANSTTNTTTSTANANSTNHENQKADIVLGQEIEVAVLDYSGPPLYEKCVIWQKFDEQENKWKSVSDEPTYIPSSADIGLKMRAVVDVCATHELLESPVYSEKYTTPEVQITKNNPTIVRMASALFRTKKAIFDARLPMGEKVTILLENGMFLMKGGASVLLRAQYAAVHVDVIESTTDAIALKARHGYNTELTFGEKKMNGGTKFSPPQTRELFIETLNLFKNPL